MSLKGRLPDFNVVDVLQLMGFAGKTGVVRFSRGLGASSGSGVSPATPAIFFREGKPVAAEADGLTGEGALELLCSWDSGSFSYHEGLSSPQENLDLPLERLVPRAQSAVEEWREVHRVLPSPSSTLRVEGELPPDVARVELDREEWGLLAGMCSPRALSALARQAGGRLSAYRLVRRLVEQGLLRVESEEPRAAGIATRRLDS